MAKNTRSSKFRKVDVDQYDEDRFEDDHVATDGGDQGPSESEIQALISRDKYQEALQLLLQSAPIGSKNQEVKDRAANLVVRVLCSYKGDIDQCLKSLDSRQLDMLMKYIYRGFEVPTDNSSAILLNWHQKAFAVGGLGSIMRVMTDRRRV